jgi:hypothetical protein
MTPNEDAERFAELLRVVGEFYDVTVSPMRVTIFFGALQQYDWDIVREAFNRFLQTESSKFGFPKPIHIKEIIEGTESERDANVWLALEEAIRMIGVWQSLIVADPALADAVIRVWGSWIACCEFRSSADNILWNSKRKDFVAAYRIALKQPRAARDPVLLAGYCEAQNRLGGFSLKRSYYGVILLDGKVESRYLDVDTATGLPAMPLATVLALPAPTRRALLPKPEEDSELSADDARAALEATMRAVSERVKGFPKRTVLDEVSKWDPDEYDAARRELLREQARIINAEECHENSESPIAASEPLRVEEAQTAGQSDRASVAGGETTEAGDRVSVREVDRPTVESGLRMAGVSDSLRARRSGVRERDSHRARSVDDAQGVGRSGSSRASGKRDGKTRRKA